MPDVNPKLPSAETGDYAEQLSDIEGLLAGLDQETNYGNGTPDPSEHGMDDGEAGLVDLNRWHEKLASLNSQKAALELRKPEGLIALKECNDLISNPNRAYPLACCKELRRRVIAQMGSTDSRYANVVLDLEQLGRTPHWTKGNGNMPKRGGLPAFVCLANSMAGIEEWAAKQTARVSIATIAGSKHTLPPVPADPKRSKPTAVVTCTPTKVLSPARTAIKIMTPNNRAMVSGRSLPGPPPLLHPMHPPAQYAPLQSPVSPVPYGGASYMQQPQDAYYAQRPSTASGSADTGYGIAPYVPASYQEPVQQQQYDTPATALPGPPSYLPPPPGIVFDVSEPRMQAVTQPCDFSLKPDGSAMVCYPAAISQQYICTVASWLSGLMEMVSVANAPEIDQQLAHHCRNTAHQMYHALRSAHQRGLRPGMDAVQHNHLLAQSADQIAAIARHANLG